MAAVSLSPDLAGCPAGLSPADQGQSADPAAFVTTDQAKGLDRLELSVRGAKCAGCIAKIERGLLALPGVADARLNLSTNRLSVSWRSGAVAAREVTATLTRLGYASQPFDPASARRQIDHEGRALLARLAVAAFASMNIMLFSVPVWSGHGEMGDATRTMFHWISAAIAIPTALYAGQPFFRSALTALKAGRANMDVPISLGVALTIGVSLSETILGGEHAYFDGVCMLLALLLVGRYFDHALRAKAGAAARELLALQAVSANRLGPDGSLAAVPASALRPGDRLLIAPGERAPVDGRILEGVSEIDRSLLTGETAPAAARPGDALHAGVINLLRPLTIEATSDAQGSTIAELSRLIEAGEQRRAGFMRLADRAAQLYVPVVHTLAALTFAYWLFIADAGLRQSLMIAATVLIITCPCALGLAAPAVQVVATGRLFKAGVFVKSGDALERLAQADRLALDKTGTLTLGRPKLVAAQGVPAATLQAAASLARLSRHPLSRALTEAAGPGAPAKDAVETPGEGVAGLVAGPAGLVSARLGKRAFAAPDAAPIAQEQDDEALQLWYAEAGQSPVVLRFVDALRPDAEATIAALKARGYAPVLISGDRPGPVAAAARAAGIADWRAEASPQDKIAALEALRREGHAPLMLGDGLNDAACLAAAHVSAAPGSAVDAAQAASDLVIQGERMGPILEAIDVAKAARARMIENFAFAALYNLLAAPLAAAGHVTPMIAALAMSGSSILVMLNALRLSRSRAASIKSAQDPRILV